MLFISIDLAVAPTNKPYFTMLWFGLFIFSAMLGIPRARVISGQRNDDEMSVSLVEETEVPELG